MPLAKVLEKPGAWVDVPVVLRVTFSGRAASPDPYYTRFTERRWSALAVWPAALPEERRAATPAFERLFVRRQGLSARRAVRLTRGDTVDVRAVVRDVVRGVPWFEVLEITGDGDPLTALEKAQRDLAARFAARRNAAAAERLYRRLLASRELPVADRADLERRIGRACAAQKKWSAAVTALTASLRLAPGDVETEEDLVRARKRAAAEPAPGERPRRRAGGRPGLRPPAGLGDVPAPRKPLRRPDQESVPDPREEKAQESRPRPQRPPRPGLSDPR